MKNSTLQKLPALAINAAAASPLSGQMFKLILLFWGLGTLFVAVNLLGGVARVSWIFPRSPPVASRGWRQTRPGVCARLGIVRRVQGVECGNTASMPPT